MEAVCIPPSAHRQRQTKNAPPNFSIVWKIPPARDKLSSKFFHCVEKSLKVFPLCGKSRQSLPLRSLWLARSPGCAGAIELAFAHRPAGSGSALAYFPLCGKIAQTFSIAWKKISPAP
jgi:hypothetical protein